jgi:response regulator RpfG family c-di-GMP phosphodiesterase
MSSQLVQSDRDLINNHAMLAANIVGAFEFVPEEVSSIIREHHGATNGIGFPSNLNISISPISQMFIVVEDFVDQFLKIKSVPSEADINRILSKIQSK